MSEKRHKINKSANYQNIIVRHSPDGLRPPCFCFFSRPLINLVPRGPFCHALEKSGPLSLTKRIAASGNEIGPLIYRFSRKAHDQYTNPLAGPLLIALQVVRFI